MLEVGGLYKFIEENWALHRTLKGPYKNQLFMKNNDKIFILNIEDRECPTDCWAFKVLYENSICFFFVNKQYGNFPMIEKIC